MAKKKENKEENKITINKSNPRIEEIINDYPKSLIAHPRGAFEEQLKKHLEKHNIK